MAGEWIAMKLDLWECPQVVRMMSALCPHDVRNVEIKSHIIGCLYRTWSLVDRFAVDGILEGYDQNALDQEMAWDGWTENLQHVGWITIEPQRLIVPEFESHFGQSAKRRMLDAKRKRETRQNVSASCPQSVRMDADKKRTREEKRREEKRRKKKNPLPPFPENLDTDQFRAAWDDWMAHRREIKKPLTPTCIRQQFAKMSEMGPARAIAAMRHTIAMGWQGLREPDANGSSGSKQPTMREVLADIDREESRRE